MVWLNWNWITLNDGLWIVGRAWWLIFVQVNFGIAWKGLGIIRNERSSKIGFLRSNLWMLEPSDEWLKMNVRMFLLNVRTRASLGDWCGNVERSNVHSERSNVRDFGRWKRDIKRSNIPLIRSNVWLRWCVGLECESSNSPSKCSNSRHLTDARQVSKAITLEPLVGFSRAIYRWKDHWM